MSQNVTHSSNFLGKLVYVNPDLVPKNPQLIGVYLKPETMAHFIFCHCVFVMFTKKSLV